jgi:hypothetical protein
MQFYGIDEKTYSICKNGVSKVVAVTRTASCKIPVFHTLKPDHFGCVHMDLIICRATARVSQQGQRWQKVGMLQIRNSNCRTKPEAALQEGF